jgi:hypothetical protein
MDCPARGPGVSKAGRMPLPRFPRAWLSVAAAALLLLPPGVGRTQDSTSSPARSAPSPLGLTWATSDPGCDGSAVAARALELVAKGITPRPTQARAQVERDGDHWVVDLETRSESQIGRRRLRGESCKEIQQAIALLLAMILESEAKAESAPAPVGAVSPPAVPEPPTSLDSPVGAPEQDAPPPPPPRGPRNDGFGWALRMEGTAAMGLQPSLGLGVGASIAAAYGPFELHVGGAYWPTSQASIFERDGTIEMSRKILGLSACYRLLDRGVVQALPCVGPERVWTKWRSTGLSTNRQDDPPPEWSLTASLELRLQVFGPMFLLIAPGITWEQPQPFEAQPCNDCALTPVFQTWPVGPRLTAGVGARF